MQRNMTSFRKMTDKDLAYVAELEREAFSDAWKEQSILDTLRQQQAFIAVAATEGAVVGYCIVYFVMDEAEIARIAVSRKSRRQGIARRLMDYTCECCREKEIRRLMLDVRESNEAARAFYQKYGFETDGIRKDFYDLPKENAVLMSLSL